MAHTVTVPLTPYTLQYYTERVRDYSTEQLRNVIAEINAILPNFEADAQQHRAYIAKLYNELDACRSELQRRK